MVAANVIEIEIAGPTNESFFFQPLSRRVRGRLDFNLVPEPTAKMMLTNWPAIIPGQRIGLDTTEAVGYVADPIHDDAKLKAKIEKQFTLGPAREESKAAHVPSWLHWMKAAVDSGIARVTQGSLPDRIEGTPQPSTFRRSTPTAMDRFTKAIEAQTTALTELVKSIANKR